MQEYTIYHNPRCSKSRQTLQLLKDNGIEPKVVEYLNSPPSVKELKAILKALNCSAQDILRTKEDEYKQSGLNNDKLTVNQQLELMVQFPKVIERPIVVKNDKAVIGRPPENVLELI